MRVYYVYGNVNMAMYNAGMLLFDEFSLFEPVGDELEDGVGGCGVGCEGCGSEEGVGWGEGVGEVAEVG